MSRSYADQGRNVPSSWATTSNSRSRLPDSLPRPCQPGRKRARAAAGTGSTSRRRRASERRRVEPLDRIRPHAPRGNFGGRQIADPTQQIVQLIAIAHAAFAEPLQLDLQVDHGRWVEQLAQLLLAEQLAQALAVERKGLRASLRQRRIALVHVLGDVVEEQ